MAASGRPRGSIEALASAPKGQVLCEVAWLSQDAALRVPQVERTAQPGFVEVTVGGASYSLSAFCNTELAKDVRNPLCATMIAGLVNQSVMLPIWSMLWSTGDPGLCTSRTI